MDKIIPCFICRCAVTVKDELAIGTLCSKHKTKVNLEKLAKADTKDLLKIIEEGVKETISKNKISKASKVRKKNKPNINKWGEVL